MVRGLNTQGERPGLTGQCPCGAKSNVLLLLGCSSTKARFLCAELGCSSTKARFLCADSSSINTDDKSFVCKDGVWEDSLCLFQEGVFVFYGGTEMAYTKLPYPCVSGQSGCLKGCRVHGLFCSECTFVKISCFVIKQIYTLDNVFQLWQIDGIRAIGEGTGRGGWRSEAFVWNDGTIFGCPRSTCLDVVYLANRDVIGFNHFPTDVRQVGFLAEEIAASGKPVFQGNAMNRDAAIFVNEVVPSRIDRMEEDFVLDVAVVGVLQEVKELAYLLWPMDVQFGSTSQQIHRAYQSWQSEYVVAMVVADEDMTNAHHRESHLLHLCLHTFATIDHEEFAPHIQDLRGWLVTCGGLC